jgi:hypothetical protein
VAIVLVRGSVAGRVRLAIWNSSTSGFHRLSATKPVSSETSKAEQHEPFGTICLILAFTGMRIGEALAIRRQDLDFDLKLIHVRYSVYAGELRHAQK